MRDQFGLDRGLYAELTVPPADATSLFAVLRDLVYVSDEIMGNPSIDLETSSGITNAVFYPTANKAARLVGVFREDPDDRLHRDVVMVGMPTVVVGHHRDGGVAHLRFTGELGLRHIGHADHVAVPCSIELRFG